MTVFVEADTEGCPNCGHPLKSVGSPKWQDTKTCTHCPCRFFVYGDGPDTGILSDKSKFDFQKADSGSWPL